MAGRRKKKRATFGDIMRTLLMLIALVVFLFSGYTLYGYYNEYKKGTDEYDNLESNFAIEVEEDETEDFDALESDEALQSITGREVATVWENGKEVTIPTMKNPIDFAELKSVQMQFPQPVESDKHCCTVSASASQSGCHRNVFRDIDADGAAAG